jgi:hypothetical protein
MAPPLNGWRADQAKLPWPTAIEKADVGDLFSSINQEREISVFTSLGADWGSFDPST